MHFSRTLLSLYIHGIAKNTKTSKKQSLPTNNSLQSYWVKRGSPQLMTFMKAQHSFCCSHPAAQNNFVPVMFYKKKTDYYTVTYAEHFNDKIGQLSE